nr:protein SCAI isoform X1 [Tanacetum cinerariifolium]
MSENEVYRSLVAKADKEFSKIRDLPYYHHHRYDTHFHKVFKVYTHLWKFQQENRHKLMEAGLKRWEIGDIASRIGQLYFGQYMRTSQAKYLSEAYIFYEAVLTREYFKDGLSHDLNLANKQLRFLARFLTVCLVFNRREIVHQLVNQLIMLVAECKRTFPETDFKEWKLVIRDVTKFLKVDTAFTYIRPLRYSIVLDADPDRLPRVALIKRKLRLKDAILCSYHPNEVKFSELTIDSFRMLQCLEWEPSGSFYQSSGVPSTGGAGTNVGQSGGLIGSSRINYSQEMTDPTLPPNPRKAVLYHPSITHLIAVLATMCEELPADGVLLIYISASGSGGQTLMSPVHMGNYVGDAENIVSDIQRNMIQSEAVSTLPSCSACDSIASSVEKNVGDDKGYHSGGLNLGSFGNGGFNTINPYDLLPFTRRPLFLVVDSDNSKAFQAINRAEKGEPVALLLSPSSSCPMHGAIDPRQPSGSQFTSFLTVPLQSLIVLLGFTGSDIDMEKLNKAQTVLTSSLDQWGEMLASLDTLHPVWAQVLEDPFLRRLLLRFIFCRAVLSLYAPTSGKKEYLPECSPPLPDALLPTTPSSIATVLQIADIFGAATMFNIRERI